MSNRFMTAMGLALITSFLATAASVQPAVSTSVYVDSAGLSRGTLNGVEVTADGSISAKRKNLLRNASFERDTWEHTGYEDGLAVEWNIWGEGYGKYNDRSIPTLPGVATHGEHSQCLELTANGRETLTLGQTVNGLQADLPYTFSVDVKVDAPDAMEVCAELQAYSGSTWMAGKQSAWTSPVSFTRIAATGMLPAGCDRITVCVALRPKTENAHGKLWVDSAQLEQGKEASSFSAGFSPGDAEYVSVPLKLPKTGIYKLSWIASQPSATDLVFQIRSAKTKDALQAAEWCSPAGLAGYSRRSVTSPNLIADASVESVADAKGTELIRNVGYGENDRAFSVVEDAHSGKKALKVAITKHEKGDGRWHVATSAPIENETEYVFSVWHKENAANTPIRLSVSYEDSAGAMHWGKHSESREASTEWKQDVLTFKTETKIAVKRLWVQVALNGPGWIVSDDYCVKKNIVAGTEWAVNPAHKDDSWCQVRALFSTHDSFYSARLYRFELACGTPVPVVRWFNVLASEKGPQKYAFNPGQTACFRPQILEFSGATNIRRVTLRLQDPSGKEYARTEMTRHSAPDEHEAVFAYDHTFAANAPAGEWLATVTVTNAVGAQASDSILLKVRPPYQAAPQQMLVGAIGGDYGFAHYEGPRFRAEIERFKTKPGVDLWKLALNWSLFEPTPGAYNYAMLSGVKVFISEANAAGAKAQVTIQQQRLPAWVNDGDWDNRNRYGEAPTRNLCATWAYLASALSDCPGLDSYLLINEENAVYDADVYLRSMMKVAAAVRGADPERSHRITIRPNTHEPYLRTRIATDGAQDYDYGSGGYPTSASWYFKHYASPASDVACLRMAMLHESPLAFGGPGGMGEIGFMRRSPPDTFGDEERLAGFQRSMIIAYEMGMDEFVLWGGGFTFENLDAYIPKLLAFRDELIKKPRPNGFDVRVLVDTDEKLWTEPRPAASELDVSAQRLAPLFKYLDERGYVWFLTKPEAAAIQKVNAKATLALSELKDKSGQELLALIVEKLREIKPGGTPLPWPDGKMPLK